MFISYRNCTLHLSTDRQFSIVPCFSMTDLSTEEIIALLVDLMKRKVPRAFS